MSHWNVFSNHGHVLLFLARKPDARLRDVAASVGITERAVQKILRDMQESGVITVSKHGRRNSYAIDTSASLRHDLEAHRSVGDLIELIGADLPAAEEAAGAPSPPRPVRPVAAPVPQARENAPLAATAATEAAPQAEPTAPAVPEPLPAAASAGQGAANAVKEKTEAANAAGKASTARKKRKRKPSEPDGGEQGSLF
jgi:DNA-binding MarR family transcriptional regulator